MSLHTIQLYSRPDCHLCDEALALIQAAGLIDQVEEIDIEPDLSLLRSYGDKVPVLRWANGKELHWPFTLVALQQQHQEVINNYV